MNNIESKDWDVEVLQSKVPVIVDFFAEWCGPCKTMSTVLDQLEKDHKNVKIVKYDITDESLAKTHSIKSIPTLVLFTEGKETSRISGLVNLQKVKDTFAI